MIVAKKISFDAAHHLPNYRGKCSVNHGHHWIVELAVEGPVREFSGMVVDFKELKEVLELIKKTFDHTDINDTIFNPTAENIALYIAEVFDKEWIYSNEVKLAWIKVWETEDSMVVLESR